MVRIDGRGFTRLTKEALPLERPFDPRFRALMEATARHLMRCGFRAVFAYAQSDEISLLLHRGESAYGRSLRKWVSVLAGEARGHEQPKARTFWAKQGFAPANSSDASAVSDDGGDL